MDRHTTVSFNGPKNCMVAKSQCHAWLEDSCIVLTTPEVIPGSTIGGKCSYHLSTFDSSSCVIDSRLTMQMHTTSRLLLPAHCDSAEVAAVKEAARLYDQFLPKGVDCLEAEFLRWKAYWTRHSTDRRPKRVLEALSNASILGTFPSISIYSPPYLSSLLLENGPSALWSMSNLTCGQRCARTGWMVLAQLFINKDLMLNRDDVIDEFSKENRRLSYHWNDSQQLTIFETSDVGTCFEVSILFYLRWFLFPVVLH